MIDTKNRVYLGKSGIALAYLAAMVAVEAPVRANKYASTAKVSWPLVQRIRELLEADGVDWELAATMHKEIEEREKRERYARYASSE